MTGSGSESVSLAIARELAAAGIDTAFGHPGGEISVFMEALREVGIRYILTHHETFAAFMAHGYGEITGRPGLCVATLGPGATNMVTGVANAYLDRAPLIAVTADLATDSPKGKTHQDLDLTALYAPITKASIEITPENAISAARYALNLSLEHPRGPVHLALASDITAMATRNGKTDRFPTETLDPDNMEVLTTVAGLLNDAERPAVLLGLRTLGPGVAEPLVDLIRSTGSVAAATPKAKGVFPETDELSVGVLEMAGDDIVVELLQKADLLLLVGLDVVELDKPWRLNTTTVHIDALPNTDKFYPAEFELVGDMRAILASLRRDGRSSRWPAHELVQHRRRLDEYVSAEGKGLQPWQVVKTVQGLFPDDTIVVTDTGAHKFLVAQVWRAMTPRTFFLSNGLSSMGYGVPVGATAALLNPDRPVISFVGDGGFGMYVGELETLQRMRIDMLIVVFADGTLELIRRSQLSKNLAPFGTSFENPDFKILADSFNLKGYEARTSKELSDIIEEIVPIRGVKIVVAHINGDDYRL